MTAWYLIIGFFTVYFLVSIFDWIVGVIAAALLGGAVVLYVLWKRQRAMKAELDALLERKNEERPL